MSGALSGNGCANGNGATRARPSDGTGTLLSALSDRDLVLAFQAGDLEAFAAIDRRHRPAVLRVCRRMLSNPQDAEDAAQEVMIRVLSGLGRFNGRYLLEAWVCRIAQNHCLDLIRRAARRPATVPVQAEDAAARHPVDDSPVGLVVERGEERAAIVAALDRLPAHHRAALVMRELQGASHAEIAGALGTTSPRVKALLHRAKRGFRDVWAGEGRLARLLFPVAILRRLAGLARLERAESLSPVASVSTSAAAAAQGASTGIQSVGASAVASNTVAAAISTVASAAPAAVAVASAVSERVTAGIAAVVVAAGTIGAGVVSRPAEALRPAVTVETQLGVALPSLLPIASVGAQEQPLEVSVGPSPEPVSGAAVPGADPSPVESVPPSASPEPRPSPQPSPSASATPAGGPRPSPSSSPVASESPSPAAAPGYRLSIGVSRRAEHACGCEGWRLIASRIQGRVDEEVDFEQEAEGVARDADGTAAWMGWVTYSANTSRADGDLAIRFTLRSSSGDSAYGGDASLSSQATTNGGVTQVFEGPYDLLDASGAGSSEPAVRRGTFRLVITWWSDMTTITAADLSIQEG
ncbi:MAG: sigma-70 family RNA polymerase sigma factor [Acidobacteria bacterium]|nr:sigma-70 family RNA polymerase sigma factor [Acidobacteriota bacterium]